MSENNLYKKERLIFKTKFKTKILFTSQQIFVKIDIYMLQQIYLVYDWKWKRHYVCRHENKAHD